MKRMWMFGIGIALCVSLTFPTAEARTLAEITKAGQIVVGAKADQPPWGGLDPQGRIVGWEPDLAHKLAEYLLGNPNKVRFVAVVGANRIPFLQSEKIDICWATMTNSPERAKQIDFSIPYFHSSALLMVKKDSSIKDIEDLKGKTVILIKGTMPAIVLEKLMPDAHYIKFDTTSEAMQALRDGRGVAFAQSDLQLFEILAENPQFKLVGRRFTNEIWGVGLRKGEEDIKAFVNLAISHMYHTGFLLDSVNKWWKGDYLNHIKGIAKEQFEKYMPEMYRAK
jgi:ABC-type amino acid transport substrate-binding protein